MSFNVREALDSECKKPLRFEKAYIKKSAPDARDCKRRADALIDIAEAVTHVGADVPNEMPDELIDSYNDIVARLYELADLEFSLYKAYR